MVIKPKPLNNILKDIIGCGFTPTGLLAQSTDQKNLKAFLPRTSNKFQPSPLLTQKRQPTRVKLPNVIIEDETDGEDVIDLGAPRGLVRLEGVSSTFPPRRTRRSYVPNPRLYPGPQTKQSVKSKPKRVEGRGSAGRARRRKHVLRRPVPNSRLYRPAPPRPPPPPLQPRAGWPPPQPPHALDTASRVALHLGEQRRGNRSLKTADQTPAPRHRSPSPSPVNFSQSPPSPPPPPSRRLVVTLPQAAGGDSPQLVPRYRPTSAHFKARDIPSVSGESSPPAARIPTRNNTMDTASHHSTSPDDRSEGNETHSAPSEFLAEFLSAIMRRQYAEALKYCRLILQYEPQNATARGFYPLLRHKVQSQRKKNVAAEGSPSHGGSSHTASSRQSDGISPIRVEVTPDPQRDGRHSRLSSSSASPSPPPPQAMDQEADSAESDAEDVEEGSAGSVASQSSLELDSSDLMHSSPSFSLSRQTDSICWESTGSVSRSDADDNGNAPPPASTGNTSSNAIYPGDLENDNAAGEPVHIKKSTESLRRLREQFACSIK